ncbi:DUF427 domain-containing protein [Microbacterium resistens]|uniref:DUF427 domain-containing protein n=1 Tax=Microbacterium resistens TaxID=156977 RepID=A0ABY3RRS4_9MICO|nr:DUF427 domain-containing protein [Microbacterium resistens]MDA4890330.1 DUF427 domain-containing protein [Streptomyces sp. MS2A]UGS25575.1 DUF427 domain-containing protein [Microbacterium resistens]
MRAVLAGTVIAEADDAETILIEGNHYFPPSAVREGVLVESPTPYTCPWKGVCQYYSVVADGETHADLAWSYPEPYPSGIERVGRDFSGYVAFAPGVEVERSSG